MSVKVPKRSIQELRMRYKLEPHLKDIYVEGKFDKDLLTAVFALNNIHDRIVYDINSVNVPSEIMIEENLTSGNKQRVICLARKTSNLSPDCNFRCLVDKDLDGYYGTCLLYTSPSPRDQRGSRMPSSA